MTTTTPFPFPFLFRININTTTTAAMTHHHSAATLTANTTTTPTPAPFPVSAVILLGHNRQLALASLFLGEGDREDTVLELVVVLEEVKVRGCVDSVRACERMCR